MKVSDPTRTEKAIWIEQEIKCRSYTVPHRIGGWSDLSNLGMRFAEDASKYG